jgi:hypothetical protein
LKLALISNSGFLTAFTRKTNLASFRRMFYLVGISQKPVGFESSGSPRCLKFEDNPRSIFSLNHWMIWYGLALRGRRPQVHFRPQNIMTVSLRLPNRTPSPISEILLSNEEIVVWCPPCPPI